MSCAQGEDSQTQREFRLGKIINFYFSLSAQSASWGEVPENITAVPFCKFKKKKKKKVDEEGKGKQRYRKKVGRGGVGMGS